MKNIFQDWTFKTEITGTKKFSDKNDSGKEYLVKKILGMKIYSQENGHAELVRLGLVTELCNPTPICAN